MSHQKHHVFTRRRFDGLFLVISLCGVTVGTLLAWFTGEWRFATAPFGVIPVCLFLRLMIPKTGVPLKTFRGNPDQTAWLLLSVLVVGSIATLAVADRILVGHGFFEPSPWYHMVVFLIALVMMIAGSMAIHRRWPGSSVNRPQDKAGTKSSTNLKERPTQSGPDSE